MNKYLNKIYFIFYIEYTTVSILPVISKIFERIIFEQISSYIDSFLSSFLSGFRQGFGTQHCLIVMLE